jgi:segregation and condensation protein A
VAAPFHVQQEAFQGPLDLLLALIEKRKLLINDISLANVADDFIHYVEQHPEFPLSQTANFVLVGSTLLLIKSKSLLPVLTLTEEEQDSIEDLEHRLKQLEVYKRIAAELNTAMDRVLRGLPSEKVPVPEAIVERVMSLEEMIDQLAERVNSSIRTSFREFSQSRGEAKVHVVVSFLAMLELVKQGLVRVEQESQFGDIVMENDQVGVPRYG